MVCLSCRRFTKASKAIGIDLGLKDIATCSDGTVISNPKFYRKYEQKLGIAQRAKNKKRIRALHAKIANCRKDHLHKASIMLVKENSLIVVGDLSAKKLVKTKMAKSVLDTGFSAFKTMLKYKCENASEPYRVCRRVNILSEKHCFARFDDKIKIYP